MACHVDRVLGGWSFLYCMHSEVGHMCQGAWLIVLLFYKQGLLSS